MIKQKNSWWYLKRAWKYYESGCELCWSNCQCPKKSIWKDTIKILKKYNPDNYTFEEWVKLKW